MTVQNFVDVLNDALSLDPDAMRKLIDHRVPVNNALADHPRIITLNEKSDEPLVLGALGLMNAVAGADGQLIEAVYDCDRLVLFRIAPKKS